jgi:tRNA modification GTPase
MFSQDTICAISTPPGEGGIGIIRISGRDAISIALKIFRIGSGEVPSTGRGMLYGRIVDPKSGEIVDEALMSVMRAPATYTREDVVELNCHGGTMPLSRTLALVVACGARQAEPGEFTKRAFLNGRIDLAQAEAVMDVISAKTEASSRAAGEQLLGKLSGEVTALRDSVIAALAAVEAAIDFPEEDIEPLPTGSLESTLTGLKLGIDALLATYEYGRIVRDGFAVAIVGRPNVGKSSLLNALCRRDRAIVTEIPGTTRDVLEEYLNINGVPVKILDTAGIRHSHDLVEQEGVRRSLIALDAADLVLFVLDGSLPLAQEDRALFDQLSTKKVIAVINKSDMPRALESFDTPSKQVLLSCKTERGLNELRDAIAAVLKQGMGVREQAWAVNQRHKTALELAKASLEKASGSVRERLSHEFIAVDLRDALDSLGTIIGATYTEDILDRIFRDFCIGK